MNTEAGLDAEPPLGVVTVTGSVPGALPGGLVTNMELSLLAKNCGAAMAPKETPVAPLKPDPVMVICVPPLTVPNAGKTLMTLGGISEM